ncbi:MAG: TlyA family RNA methyltransferase [Lachnospiraceae bacterium]|nr:TlyA family RNA methyltransferase [Lachnospiraceae bacterium]
MKERLDVILTGRGLASSREKAKALIMSGNVFVNGQREDKPGTMIDSDKAEIMLKENAIRYVSRGGLKLEKALKEFDIDLEGLVCMDIGASTGGFTDCMLQNKAAFVYSIDVGYGQLDWKLRNDERVSCFEKTNFRYMSKDRIDRPVDFASADVSFISLSKILPNAAQIIKDGAEMVCLIKPQFEAGRDKVGKKGVVKDIKIHEEVIRNVIVMCTESGFLVKGLSFSPIKGPEGNIEYLIYIKKIGDDGSVLTINSGFDEEAVHRVTVSAHEELDK